jgi:hypothetical protein
MSDRIDQAIAALGALNGNAVTPAETAAKPAVQTKASPAAHAATRRVVSPEARQRMAEDRQKRWAKKKPALKAAAKKAAVAPAAVKSAKKAPKKIAPTDVAFALPIDTTTSCQSPAQSS